MCECIEERGFSSVGVSDKCNHSQGNSLARTAPCGALPANRFDRLLDLADAVADASAVGFEFLFARAARPDAAAQPRKLFTTSGEPRQQIIQLREFHLELALARPRMARNNIEDELRAVDHTRADSLFH